SPAVAVSRVSGGHDRAGVFTLFLSERVVGFVVYAYDDQVGHTPRAGDRCDPGRLYSFARWRLGWVCHPAQRNGETAEAGHTGGRQRGLYGYQRIARA